MDMRGDAAWNHIALEKQNSVLTVKNTQQLIVIDVLIQNVKIVEYINNVLN